MTSNQRRKNFIYIAVFTVVLLAILIYMMLFVQMDEARIPLTVRIDADGASEEIYPWYDGSDTWYFFLPSYANLDSAVLSVHDKTCYLEGELLTGDRYLSFAETGKEYSFKEKILFSEAPAKVVFLKSANVATLYVHTESGNMNSIYANKNREENTLFRLIDETGHKDYAGTKNDRMKGRGNSSWIESDKKPFKITLEKEASLLGMDNSREWILLANGLDETNLRNKLVFDFAKDFFPGWTPSLEYVDLYLNGEYNGLYLLSEKIEVEDGRLELDNPEKDFLINSLQESKLQAKDVAFKKGSVADSNDTAYFRIDYPKNCSEERLGEIEASVHALDKEIISGDLSRLDMDSWTRRFIIDEFFANMDLINASSYYHYDSASDKFIAGPIWDFDLSIGSTATEWSHRTRRPVQIISLRRSWYRDLYQNEEFLTKTQSIYQSEALPKLNEMLERGMPQLIERLSDAGTNNSIRWRTMFDGVYMDGKTPEERISDVREFLEIRMAYFDEIWFENNQYCIVTFYDTDRKSIKNSVMARIGSPLSECPELNDETEKLWHRIDDESLFDMNTVITGNLELYSDPTNNVITKDSLFKIMIAESDVIILATFLAMIAILTAAMIFTDIKRRGKGGRHGQL